MSRHDEKNDFLYVAGELISHQKYGEAINYLQKTLDKDKDNAQALVLLEQIKNIIEYQNRDLFSSTNMDMDPWLE